MWRLLAVFLWRHIAKEIIVPGNGLLPDGTKPLTEPMLTYHQRGYIQQRLISQQVFIGNELTHWGRVTHICVGNLTIIGSDNGLSPGRRQAITWTNVGILLIGPLGTNFSEILIETRTF